MKRERILVIALVVSVAINLGVISAVKYRSETAKRGAGSMLPPGHEINIRSLQEGETLSGAQIKEIEKITRKTAEEITVLRKEAEKMWREVDSASGAGNIDDARISELLDGIASVGKEINKKTLYNTILVRKVRNAKQGPRTDSLAEIEKITRRTAEEMRFLKREIAAKWGELEDMITRENFDEKKMDQLLEEIASMEKELNKKNIYSAAHIRKIHEMNK